MKNFERLLGILDALLAPGGCPWDLEQTLKSMRGDVLEETCEVIEAIDLNDSKKIIEEIGDLFFVVCFLCRMAEKEGHGNMDDSLTDVAEKLIRRHPHVFGNGNAETTDAVLEQWEEIKDSENGGRQARDAIRDIPKNLPALSRAQKLLKRLGRAGANDLIPDVKDGFHSEDELGKELLHLVARARKSKLDPELALGKTVSEIQDAFIKSK